MADIMVAWTRPFAWQDPGRTRHNGGVNQGTSLPPDAPAVIASGICLWLNAVAPINPTEETHPCTY